MVQVQGYDAALVLSIHLMTLTRYAWAALELDLSSFRRHFSTSFGELVECQRAQQVYASDPRTEIYNFWNRHQAAILVA